jgi:predicted AAA+ superfamily ATPase
MNIRFEEQQIRNRIMFDNPWWYNDHQIDGFYQKMKRREYLKLFFPLVIERSVKRALVLMGPRRVGKTVMLFHAIDELINIKKIEQNNICYLSIETPVYNGLGLDELLNKYLEITGNTHTAELYVFFDEIQYLKDWEVHLKSLVDSYHNIKFIVSGSAAAALKMKSNESGAGRFTDFILPPLTFQEYLLLNDIPMPLYKGENEGKINIDELNKYFVEYINYGGYPEVSMSQEIKSDVGRYLKNDILDKVLLKDLPGLYGIDDIRELYTLFTYIAYHTGNEMSLEGISQDSGVTKNTIVKYLAYLEAAFLIKIVHRIDQNGKRFMRANFFKVYLTNPSLRTALFSPVLKNDVFMGNMVETAFISQYIHAENFSRNLYYAKWKTGEIDIVFLDNKQKPATALEIKWSNRFAEDPKQLKNLKSFCEKHKIEAPVVTTIDIDRFEINDKTTIEFRPASELCLSIGRNIIEGKKIGLFK